MMFVGRIQSEFARGSSHRPRTNLIPEFAKSLVCRGGIDRRRLCSASPMRHPVAVSPNLIHRLDEVGIESFEGSEYLEEASVLNLLNQVFDSLKQHRVLDEFLRNLRAYFRGHLVRIWLSKREKSTMTARSSICSR